MRGSWVTASLYESSAAVSTAIFLFSAMAAGPRQVMSAGIKALDPTWRICGTAFTIRLPLYRE